MRTASQVAALAALLFTSTLSNAGPAPPASIKLPTMEDAPAQPSAQPASAARKRRDPNALPAPMPYVVMYTTRHCGYCAQARVYMAARGISWEEQDIEASPQARAQHRQYGSKGVPFFVIGNEVLQGFSPAALNGTLWRAAQ